MPTVHDLVRCIEAIAPPRFAEPWDKVGLQVGRPDRELDGPVLLTIDLTEVVLDEAITRGAAAVVAYHPLLFHPLTSLTAGTTKSRIALGCAEHRIAVYSPHTALDAAPDGVTDWLCRGLAGRGSGDVRALRPLGEQPSTEEVKLVSFVPAGALAEVRQALATAGAGIIGNYRLCSFEVSGQGTFFPEPGANPTVGTVGSLEQAEEHRLEMVCSRGALPLAIETLRRFHPYEEPAFDIYALEPKPRRGIGAGRRLVLDQPAPIREIAERLRGWLGTSRLRAAVPAGRSLDDAVRSVAVVPGSGGELLEDVKRAGLELFVTGEMTHHTVLDAIESGVSVLLAGHTNTERGYLGVLEARLAGSLGGVEFGRCAADGDPLTVV